jgi:hypothetical protein
MSEFSTSHYTTSGGGTVKAIKVCGDYWNAHSPEVATLYRNQSHVHADGELYGNWYCSLRSGHEGEHQGWSLNQYQSKNDIIVAWFDYYLIREEEDNGL